MVVTKANYQKETKAVVRYVRVSASKVRPILDEIRGLSVSRALEILTLSERSASQIVQRCLNSAVANAGNNDSLPADELYVSACFANEGPTLKRWRPRARGRATGINKRTTHLTVIVTQYDSEELQRLQELDTLRNSESLVSESSSESIPEESSSDRRRRRKEQEEIEGLQDDLAQETDSENPDGSEQEED